jgi:hypothetical protein
MNLLSQVLLLELRCMLQGGRGMPSVRLLWTIV